VDAQIDHWELITTIYYAFPICTNALCTLLIVGKLLIHRRMIHKHDMRSSTDYNFITTLIAESGLFYAAAGITNVVLMTRFDDLANISNAVFTAAAQLTEAHIILRITLGTEARVDCDPGIVGSALVFGTRCGETNSHAMGRIAHVDINASSGSLEAWTRSSQDDKSLPVGRRKVS
jgi:hypothetical protein